MPVQLVRSPEEALLDPALRRGRLRGRGRRSRRRADPGRRPHVRASACPSSPGRAIAAPGEHTAAVRAEADAAPRADACMSTRGRNASTGRRSRRRSRGSSCSTSGWRSPARSARSCSSDLGADVIKVNNALFDSFWMRNHIAFCCNRGKRSITIDLKQTRGHGRPARARADGRRRAAQHALRRRRTARRRLRVA